MVDAGRDLMPPMGDEGNGRDASAALEESERRFRAIFDSTYQLQMLLDLEGVVLEANRAAEELTGSTSAALRGRTLWEVLWSNANGSVGAQVRERFLRVLAGETARFEASIDTPHDDPAIIDFTMRPIEGSDGRVLQLLLEGRDLTDRKRAEESLREIGALTSMGQIAARVAHEINNPLAGIQNAFLLLRGAIPTDHPHYNFVGAIEREIARIAAVTRQLYETYRSDHAMTTTSSVILAIGDAVDFLEHVNRRNVRILRDVTRAPSLVPVPDALIRQTLYNLVQNAVDASPVNGTVHVAIYEEGDECVIRVGDGGAGIPADIRSRIFEPFFSTKDRALKPGGMGIGLALVRQSVMAVGGRIIVRDREGGGTEFEVRLPMKPIHTGVLR